MNQEKAVIITNTDEAGIFTPASEIEESMEVYITKALPRLPRSKAEEGARLYHATNPVEMHQQTTQLKSDCTSIFVQSTCVHLMNGSVLALPCILDCGRIQREDCVEGIH